MPPVNCIEHCVDAAEFANECCNNVVTPLILNDGRWVAGILFHRERGALGLPVDGECNGERPRLRVVVHRESLKVLRATAGRAWCAESLTASPVVKLDYFLAAGAEARNRSLHTATILDLKRGKGAIAERR